MLSPCATQRAAPPPCFNSLCTLLYILRTPGNKQTCKSSVFAHPVAAWRKLLWPSLSGVSSAACSRHLPVPRSATGTQLGCACVTMAAHLDLCSLHHDFLSFFNVFHLTSTVSLLSYHPTLGLIICRAEAHVYGIQPHHQPMLGF